jgi:two-component system response regulator GlrR
MLTHAWPGNVRELVATIERAMLSAQDGVIDAEDITLPSDKKGAQPAVLPYRDAKAEFERAYYERLMRTTKGNVSMAAALAKKTRKEIYEALRRTGLAANNTKQRSVVEG